MRLSAPLTLASVSWSRALASMSDSRSNRRLASSPWSSTPDSSRTFSWTSRLLAAMSASMASRSASSWSRKRRRSCGVNMGSSLQNLFDQVAQVPALGPPCSPLPSTPSEADVQRARTASSYATGWEICLVIDCQHGMAFQWEERLRGPSTGIDGREIRMAPTTGSTVPSVSTHPDTGRTALIAAVAAIGGFLFGFDTAVINGAVAAVASNFHEGAVRLGLSVSAALLGSAVGALVGGRLGDRFGRVPTMVVAALLFLVQSFGVGLSFTVYDFSFWRFLGGIAVGVASVIAPAYIAESTPAELRGRLGSFQQLAIVTGIFIALLADYAIALSAGGAANTWLLGLPAWRWMFLTETIPALVYLVGALQIPESP